MMRDEELLEEYDEVEGLIGELEANLEGVDLDEQSQQEIENELKVARRRSEKLQKALSYCRV